MRGMTKRESRMGDCGWDKERLLVDKRKTERVETKEKWTSNKEQWKRHN